MTHKIKLNRCADEKRHYVIVDVDRGVVNIIIRTLNIIKKMLFF